MTYQRYYNKQLISNANLLGYIYLFLTHIHPILAFARLPDVFHDDQQDFYNLLEKLLLFKSSETIVTHPISDEQHASVLFVRTTLQQLLLFLYI